VQQIYNGFIPNEYLRNCQDTIFTVMVREEISNNQELKKLKGVHYIHGLLEYPREWMPNVDLFSLISKEHLQLLKDKKIFFVFDASTEGFSPVKDFPIFDILYYNCEKYNVDPSMIIYVSSNLRDETNIQNYCKEKNKKSINVFSFVSFEKVSKKKLLLEEEKQFCKQDFQEKYFSSLSRMNRCYRTLATFLLCQDPISEKALISHDKLPKNMDREAFRKRYYLEEYSVKTVIRWFKTLPRVVDKKDFKINWALSDDYYPIHRQTLFQIVNETLVDNYFDTSLFYSEKTFRPVICFQPFVIYGQKGINKHLKNIGYQTYEEWFDLSFDDEEDNILRYKKLLQTVRNTCSYLDSLTRDQKIEWRFKNEKLLEHNFNVMNQSLYSRNKLKKFLENLNEIS
jgi:hypothetical protein